MDGLNWCHSDQDHASPAPALLIVTSSAARVVGEGGGKASRGVDKQGEIPGAVYVRLSPDRRHRSSFLPFIAGMLVPWRALGRPDETHKLRRAVTSSYSTNISHMLLISRPSSLPTYALRNRVKRETVVVSAREVVCNAILLNPYVSFHGPAGFRRRYWHLG